MNNKVFSRISSLFSVLGIDMTAGSEGAGEARAYSVGFELVNSVFDNVLKNIFVQTAENTGLCMFLSLIDEKPEEDEEMSRTKVLERFIKNGEILDYDEFETALRQISPNAEILFVNGIIAIYDFAYPASAETLIKAGRFLKKYVPAFSYVYLAGGGMSFNKFDDLEMHWFQLDEVNMPFDYLNGLK